jgi:hypothetical protein
MYCGNCGTKIENTQYCGEWEQKHKAIKLLSSKFKRLLQPEEAAFQTILFIVAIIMALYGISAIFNS